MERWKGGKLDPVLEKDKIFHELITECTHAVPGGRLSPYLRKRLEKYNKDARRDIVNRVKVGCSPLFIACKKGQTEIIEYLVTQCGADIEQRGQYEVAEDRSTHIVTPVWCAAVTGRLNVVELLLKHGADINAVSDTGSTPVRSACFMTHYDIVKYLVAKGADINKPNYNGGTCLINSVQSVILCEFLLKNGANVNAKDIQNKTALHYAIQEHRLETTKLLLQNGADYKAQSRYGDDALQMACIKGATRIFENLILRIEFPPEKLANAYELLGAAFLDDHNDVVAALMYWKTALGIRRSNNLLPKQPVLPTREGYRHQKEFETLEELEALSMDLDAVRIQSLIICERILGPHHKDTIFRLMYRGAAYADVMRYQRGIDLWRRALEIRIEKDSLLYTDTCFTAQAIVRLMIDFNEKSNGDNGNDAVRGDFGEETVGDNAQRFHDIVATFKILTADIMEMRQLMNIRPVYKRQAEYFDKVLKCITHLIYLMIETAMTEEQVQLSRELIAEFVKKDVKTVTSDETVLHLCVSKLNTIRSSYFTDEEPIKIFPDHKVIKTLLECGANINARSDDGSTPLHIASLLFNFSDWLVKLLLNFGAHIDQPTCKGKTAAEDIATNLKHPSDFQVFDYITLKCLSSKAVVKYQIPYRNQVPKTLEHFIHLHEP